ncbi:MAG TPA: peptidoglycan-associated lipoprotein Pal [Longimicrobium sp.]|nr:peptidoglycan-associated lipoprotein Pal [Longimicrobium sp.]
MKPRHLALLLVLPLPLVLSGCKKRQPANPGPEVDTSTTTGGGRANADSIPLATAEANRRAEAERLERERRAREAAASAAREVLTEIVFFQYDSDEIAPEAEARLRLKAAVMRDNPNVRVRIEGHCDQRGSTEYNLALGQRRAEAVRAFLENYGIDGSRFTTVSYGEERPLMEGDDEEAYARNRRAEFGIIGGQVLTVPAELSR